MERFELREQFARDLMAACMESATSCGYYPGEVVGKATSCGAVEAARRTLHDRAPGYYYRLLYDKHRLDLSVEAVAARPKYGPLFTPEEVDVATERLRALALNV